MYGMMKGLRYGELFHRKTPLYHVDKEGLALSLGRGAIGSDSFYWYRKRIRY
jgi:hypothetical protein